MAHHQPDIGGRDRARLLAGEVQAFARPEAEPVHRRIDMQRRRAHLRAGLPEGSPFQQLLVRAEHRREAMLGVDAAAAGQEAIEDVDRRLGRGLAGTNALGEMRDEEVSAARPVQRRHGRLDADAVGVRLHDRAGFRAGAPAEEAPVRDQRVEVDGQRRAISGIGGVGGHHSRSGRRNSSARSEKRVTSASNCKATVPVGP